MFPKFHGINLAANSWIENCTVERLASDPTPITASRIWYNTVTKELKFSSLNGGGAVIVEVVATGAQVAQVVSDLAALGARVSDVEAAFINKNGSVAFTGDINAGTHKLTNLSDGVAGSDAVNKAQMEAYVANLGNAFNYVGVVEGGANSGAAFDMDTLPSGGKDAGDYYKVNVAGFFKVGSGGTPFQANVGDGLVFNTTAGVDKIDNTDSTVAGTSGYVVVTGSTDTGYTVDLDTGFKSAVADATSGLAAEISRATAAEAAIASDLSDEVTRATAAEAALTTSIGNEVTRATAAEGALSTAISSEATTRANADTALAQDITDEETRALAAESALGTAITDEATARAAADATLTTAISDEVTRATAAEAAEATTRANADTALGTSISNEVTRATAAEGVLTTNLASEVTRATGAEGTIASNLASEVTRAQAAEGVLTSDLAAEATRATAAEGVLTSNLADEVTRATAAEGVLTTAVAAVDTKVGPLASLTTTDKSSIVNAINEVAVAAGGGTDALRVKINDQRFTYEAVAPSLSHVINHSLNTGFSSVMVWVKDDGGVFRNDIVAVEETSANTTTVTLTESRIIKVTIQALDDISA